MKNDNIDVLAAQSTLNSNKPKARFKENNHRNKTKQAHTPLSPLALIALGLVHPTSHAQADASDIKDDVPASPQPETMATPTSAKASLPDEQLMTQVMPEANQLELKTLENQTPTQNVIDTEIDALLDNQKPKVSPEHANDIDSPATDAPATTADHATLNESSTAPEHTDDLLPADVQPEQPTRNDNDNVIQKHGASPAAKKNPVVIDHDFLPDNDIDNLAYHESLNQTAINHPQHDINAYQQHLTDIFNDFSIMDAIGAILGLFAISAASPSSYAAPNIGSNVTPITPTGPVLTQISGVVSDGYIRNADVYLDVNGDGKLDSGDIKIAVTNAGGSFTANLTDAQKQYGFVATGGVDISTGLAFTGVFSAPVGSTVINPLTTLLKTLIGQDTSAATIASASNRILQTLELPTGIDITTLDLLNQSVNAATPASHTAIAAQAISREQAILAQTKAVMITNIIATGTAALSGAIKTSGVTQNISDHDLAIQVVRGLGDVINSLFAEDSVLSFTDPNILKRVLQTVIEKGKDIAMLNEDAAVSSIDTIATTVATANKVLNVVSSVAVELSTSTDPAAQQGLLHTLSQMLQAQSVVQSNLTAVLSQGNANDIDTLKTSYDSTLEIISAAQNVNVSQNWLTPDQNALQTNWFDNSTPSVVSVTADNINKPFKVGDTLTFRVSMSKGVIVDGLPQLNINVGNNTQQATYNAAQSTSKTLVFTYKVAEGDSGGLAVGNGNLVIPTNASISDMNGHIASPTLNGISTSIATGNTNTNWQVDTQAITVNITSDTVFLSGQNTATLTFTLSENSPDFTVDDITVVGGSLSHFTGSGLQYTATFTPTKNITTAASIFIESAKLSDNAGNGNIASNSVTIGVDTGIPQVLITSDQSALKLGDTATITFTFSNLPDANTFSWDGLTGDISVSGGTLSTLTGTGLVRTATFTPTTNTHATATIQVLGHTFSSNSNDNSDSNQLALVVNTIAPTVTITSESALLKAGATTIVTFELSTPPTTSTFTQDDISVSGGALIAFKQSTTNPLIYTARFIPDADVSVQAHVSIAAEQFTTPAGNKNVASSVLNIDVDTLKPTVLSVTDSVPTIANMNTSSIAYTYTFSEPVTDLTLSDFIATNANVISVTEASGTGRNAVWMVTATPHQNVASGNIGINLIKNGVTDLAGNTNANHFQANQAIDTVAPTLAISSNVSAVKIGETAEITFTFSEDPGNSFTWNGTSGDITVTGGTLSAISGSGLTRTATLTPTPNLASGNAHITVNASSYTDAAGNAGGAGTTPSISIDTVAPTLTITSNVSAVKAGETALITFTFSEDPGASFSWDGSNGDVNVIGGTLSAISGSGLTRTATLTPTPNLASGSASITVSASSYTDAAGNTGGAGTTPTISLDTLPPTVTITSNMSALKIGETAVVTFTFSEDPGSSFAWNGSSGDLTVTGGTLSAISGTGLIRTATLTPTPNLANGSAHISVNANSYVDAAGNSGAAGVTPSIQIDTLAPTLSISSNANALKAGETATITFSFSEDPGTSFAWNGSSGDIVVTGGTLSAISGTGLTRTATLTPTPNLASGSASITVAANSYTDAAGNTGGVGTSPTISIDTLPPTLAITSNASALKIGETATITFTFSEDPGSSFNWDGHSGDVNVIGGTLSAISGTGLTRTAIFTPTPNLASGQASITVSNSAYTDAAGNSGTAGVTPSISIDTLAPTLTDISATTANGSYKAGDTVALSVTVSESMAVGSQITLTLETGTIDRPVTLTRDSSNAQLFVGTYTIQNGDTSAKLNANSITLSGGGNTNQDAAGNSLVTTLPAGHNLADNKNIVIDTTAPTVDITVNNASLNIGASSTVTLTFSETPAGLPSLTPNTGTLSSFVQSSQNPLIYTATYTPPTSTTSTASFTLSSWTDIAGNTGSVHGNIPSIAIDTQAPTLTSTTPNDNGLSPGLTANIVLTFSEAMQKGSGAISIYKTDGSLVETLSASSSRVSISGAQVTIDPSADFVDGQDYYVRIDDYAFTDIVGNHYAGLLNNTDFNFTGKITSVAINTVAGDDRINASEVTAVTAISGTLVAEASVRAAYSLSDITAVVKLGTNHISTATITSYNSVTGEWSGHINANVMNGSQDYTLQVTFTGVSGAAQGITVAAEHLLHVDTVSPTVSISSDVSAVKAGETATITFTFSEDPGNSFTWNGTSGDITVSGGSLSAISGSGLTRTAIFTPTNNLASGTASITVNNSYTDAAGNSGSAGSSPSLNIDTLVPTVAITSNVSTLKIGETATITFTFSEDPGNSFTWNGATGDVAVSGGVLTALSGTGLVRTATFIPTASLANGNASITVTSGSYTDAAGNAGLTGTSPSISIDTLAPSLTLSSNVSALKAGETATITFTFSEDPGTSFTWNGSSGDVLVSGGTLSAISGSGLTRTATFTPTANLASGNASITVNAATYNDAAGNSGSSGTSPSITIDTLPPTVTMTSNVSAVKIGETATITFTFSEDPGTSFTWNGTSGDITVSNGTLSAISGSGLTRTATFTPTTSLANGHASIVVNAGSYTDAAGNAGVIGTTPSISIDTLAPTLAITSNTSSLKIGETATITFTFSEDPGSAFTWDGTSGDVTVLGGTLSAISGTGLTRTATFTPSANETGTNAIIAVSASSYSDAAGNAGGAGSTPSISIDTVAPTLTLSSNVSTLKIGETATITFTFSEDPGNTFTWNGTSGDITVSGGTLSAISGTGLTRTATLTPTANLASGNANIIVSAGSYTDTAGNNGGAGTSPSISIDTLAPTLTISSDVNALRVGETATITFTFSEDPGNSFTWDGTSGDISVSGGTLSAITGTGLTRTATLTPTANLASGNANITVNAGSYNDTAGNNGSAGITPSISIDTIAPTLTISSNVSALKIGETATITFTFSEDPGSSFSWDGISGDVSVSGGTLSAISGTGLTRTATFTPTSNLASGSAYISVNSGNYSDSAGNTGGAGTSPSISIDTLAPTLSITSSTNTLKAGETATITFTFSEDPGNTFTWNGATGDVTVTGGTLGAITGTGLTRTAIFTPTANLASGSANITVAANSYTDNAGNHGGAGTTPTITIDTIVPTITSISSTTTDGSYKTGDAIVINVNVSEDMPTGTQLFVVLETGNTDRQVTLTRDSSNARLFTGTYTVQSGDTSNDLTVNSVSLASGSLTPKDAVGNLLSTTIPSTQNLANNKALIIDTIALAPTLALAVDGGNSATDNITSNGQINVSGLETGASWSYSTDSGNTWTAGSGTSFTLSGEGAHSAIVKQTDLANNTSSNSSALNFTLDSTAPTITITNDGGNTSTGIVTYTFTFSENVTGFDASDITVTNGTKGILSGSGSTYTLAITPTASASAHTMTVDVAANMAIDLAGNNNTAATQNSLSVAYGTSGLDTLTGSTGNDILAGLAGNDIIIGGDGADKIYLGSGSNTIKYLATTDSTSTSTDKIYGFSASNHIDIKGLLSGYTATLLPDTGAGFVEIKNMTLAQDTGANTTTVSFDVTFDAATISGSKISAATIDLFYNYANVIDGWVTSPTFSGRPVWQVITPNLSVMDGGTAAGVNGKIALLANTAANNPIITSGNTATGAVLNVNLVVSGLTNSFSVGLESVAAGGSTAILTADSITHNVDVGVTKSAGASAGTTGTLSVIQDTEAFTTVTDNQLHMLGIYDSATNTTHLQIKYDANANIGTTTISELLVDFAGDQTANLTPSILNYL